MPVRRSLALLLLVVLCVPSCGDDVSPGPADAAIDATGTWNSDALTGNSDASANGSDASTDAMLGATCYPDGVCSAGPTCGVSCCGSGERCVGGTCQCGNGPACVDADQCEATGPVGVDGCGSICCGIDTPCPQ